MENAMLTELFICWFVLKWTKNGDVNIVGLLHFSQFSLLKLAFKFKKKSILLGQKV
jgi:hypothetical protein